MRKLTSLLKDRKPHAVILIDYPGFNLRLAKKVKKSGIPVIYYISPQVWAWGKGRIQRIARFVDKMIVIFPFEKKLYEKVGVCVDFVGHPLKDIVRSSMGKEEYFFSRQLNVNRPTVGLFPGSREQEVMYHLPEMVEAVTRIKKEKPDLQVLLSISPHVPGESFQKLLVNHTDIRKEIDNNYDMMAHVDVAIVASGTATLETAIQNTPMVVVYRMSPLSYWMAKRMVKLDSIALVNIVAGECVVPELIQNDMTSENIAIEVLRFLNETDRSTMTRKKLEKVSDKLGDSGASDRAAKSVLDFILDQQFE
jgi:lipid-A-disaccharide synthase